MLLRDFLAKKHKSWNRDEGLKVEVVNRLSRLGYSLASQLSEEDQTTVTGIFKKAKAQWGSKRQVSNTLHVAYPVAAPLLSQKRCPNCNNLMRSAIVHDEVSADYCPNCRICKMPNE